MRYILCVGLIIVGISCTKKADTPEEALKEYISGIPNNVSNRDFYLERTSGKLKAAIQAMDEEEFKQFTSMPKLEKLKYEILHKNCQPNSCIITYTVEYAQEFEQEGKFDSASKKIAEIIMDEGQWKIANVTNLKTFIDSKTPVDIMDDPPQVQKQSN